MKAGLLLRTVLITAASIGFGAAAWAGERIEYEFEEHTEGWEEDWGLSRKPSTSKRYSNRGRNSLKVRHYFHQGDESIGIKVAFNESIDFQSQPGFEGFSAWIYFSQGGHWQAQMYVFTGGEWDISWGPLDAELKPGWHKISIPVDQIKDPSLINGLGIQVKNYDLNTHSSIYIDSVKSDYAHLKGDF
jgi:hypothetical protein